MPSSKGSSGGPSRGPSIRLFITSDLAEHAIHTCDANQTNYLAGVLRLDAGAELLVFNGRDGEWLAEVAQVGRRACTLRALKRVRPQDVGPNLWYLFAPLKRSRLDYMVQKATEMGVARLQPVLTRRTIAERVNLDRMRANAVEAAEQCGILRLPEVTEPERLDGLLASWNPLRQLIFCDEAADLASPLAALGRLQSGPLAVLIGPEGGFTTEERDQLRGKPFVTGLSLGPRVMRADTAAVAALALVNAALGDWR
jgi:16S rRNA (uracil1498-N3)-methyltransferase